MTPKGFESAIPASERPLTYVLQRTATRISMLLFRSSMILWRNGIVVTGKRVHKLIGQATVGLVMYVFRYFA